MTEPLFAVDSSVYIFRSYFSLAPRWQSKDGKPTEAVYGFSAFLLKLLLQEKPLYIAAAFDESLGTGFRHHLYPDYKANRTLPDENLAFQLKSCRQVAEVFGIPTFACPVFEADDYLATMVARAKTGQQVYVVSRDKDLMQLLSETVFLWDYGYGNIISRGAIFGTTALILHCSVIISPWWATAATMSPACPASEKKPPRRFSGSWVKSRDG